MITNTIKAQYGGPSQSSLGYSKPYSKQIEGLLMPIGYQPLKLKQFDEGEIQGNILPISSRLSSTGTHDNLLVKQFVCSLK